MSTVLNGAAFTGWFTGRTVQGCRVNPSMAGGKMLLVSGDVRDNNSGVGRQCMRSHSHNITIRNKKKRLLDGCLEAE